LQGLDLPVARELRELVAEACSSPCVEAECSAIKGLMDMAFSGSTVSLEAVRVLRRVLADAADSARSKGCFDEAINFDKASWLARVLARALGR
jgi:propanediol dehydratase small subunit